MLELTWETDKTLLYGSVVPFVYNIWVNRSLHPWPTSSAAYCQGNYEAKNGHTAAVEPGGGGWGWGGGWGCYWGKKRQNRKKKRESTITGVGEVGMWQNDHPNTFLKMLMWTWLSTPVHHTRCQNDHKEEVVFLWQVDLIITSSWDGLCISSIHRLCPLSFICLVIAFFIYCYKTITFQICWSELLQTRWTHTQRRQEYAAHYRCLYLSLSSLNVI